MSRRANSALLGVLFLTGSAVLVLEVVATRILSPYFGNTIFTVSSVIGVFLTALSGGYYVGGGLADRHPSHRYFYTIIALGGLSTLLLQLLNLTVLPWLGTIFSIVEGPLLVSLLLFLPPGFLLGMISPYGVKLYSLEHPEIGLGRVSGQIFFVSTLGSIVGTLAAGFFLIPSFGVDRIVFGTGGLLLLLGVGGLIVSREDRPLGRRIGIVGVLVLVILAYCFRLAEASVVYRADGVYERLVVADEQLNGEPVRVLRQDISDSGGMRLHSPEHLFEYTKYYSLYKVLTPPVRNVLAIGAGAYTIPKAYLDELPEVHVDVVDIEPTLLTLAQRYFNLKGYGPRLTNYVQDGRRFLLESQKLYDVVFVDVYLYSVPPHFATQEFFALAKSRLRPGGIFLANFVGSLAPTTPSLLFSEMRTFQHVFPNSHFFAVHSLQSFAMQNVIIMGVNDEHFPVMSALQSAADPFIRELGVRRISTEHAPLERQILFTDNYVPVENLTARSLLDAARYEKRNVR
jgi:spermidine synthase